MIGRGVLHTCDWESPGIYNWHDDTPLIKESTTGDVALRLEAIPASTPARDIRSRAGKNPILGTSRVSECHTRGQRRWQVKGDRVCITASRARRCRQRCLRGASWAYERALRQAEFLITDQKIDPIGDRRYQGRNPLSCCLASRQSGWVHPSGRLPGEWRRCFLPR